MTNEWRLIVTPEGENGAWNMALDEALLRSVAEGKSPTTLRLYNWQPPTVTLGIAQPANDIDFSSLSSHGWELVRRPSGGRAILHVDELTYSLNAHADEQLLTGDLLESYKLISLALLEGLKRLQVKQSEKNHMILLRKAIKKIRFVLRLLQITRSPSMGRNSSVLPRQGNMVAFFSMVRYQ